MADSIRKPDSETFHSPEISESEGGEKPQREPRAVPEKKDEQVPHIQVPVSDDGQLHLVEENKSKLLKDIERVLEEDLALLYGTLNQKQRQQFSSEGEKTAAKIEDILKKTKVTIMEIIKLIRKWLALIPGVNPFFTEKESKIKAEKILLLRKSEEEEW